MYMNPSIILWKAAMSSIHEDLEYKEFETSDKVEYRRYCTTSGLCARTGCPSVAYGYFKTSYTPFCNYHSGSETDVSDDSGYNNYYNYNYNYNDSDDDTEEKTTSKTESSTNETTVSEGETTQKAEETTLAEKTTENEVTEVKTEKKTSKPKSADSTKKTKKND